VTEQTQPEAPEPSAEATPIELGAMDLTSAESTAAGSGMDTPKPHKRRLTIVAAISALLVAGVGVGAYAGVRAWTGSGITEPESAVPASTAAFLRVDLKPGYRDQMAFDGLAKKFPSDTKSTSDLIADVERNMLKGSDLDFDKDVKPWFGQRAGVGAYAVDGGHVVGLVALASTDDAKAKQVLAREQAKNGSKAFGYVVRNGYALLAVGSTTTDLQAAAQQASNATASHSLGDDGSFRSSVSHLDGHNLLEGYADLAKVGPMMKSAMTKSAFGIGVLPGILAMGGPQLGGPLTKATGTIAVGASVVDNGVEVRVHTQGMPATTTHSVDALASLNAMPSSAIASVAFNGLDRNGDTIKQLDAMLTASARMGAVGGGAPNAGMPSMMSGLVTNILTSKLLTVEFSGVTAGRPNLVITADTGNQATAASLTQSLSGLSGGAMPGVTVKQDGTVVRASVGQEPTGDALAQLPLYQATMKGMGDASVAAYVDVQKLIASAPSTFGASQVATLAPVKAVGLSVTDHGTSTDELVRVVITK
jgi:hypothetical protein